MRLILLTIWMACGFAASVLAGPAYEADFDGEVDQVWSRKTVETTPSGKVKFLGRFSNDVVRLTLDDLADHHFVRLRFDLLIIGRWSGDRQVSGANKIIGPDQWGLDVESRVLIHTTFSNAYFRKGWTQAWPGEFGQFKAEPGSGAAAVGALGYTWKYSDVGVKRADSRYRIEVVFPHTSTELLLSFYGICLAGKQSESWGLDNVSVELLQASPYAGDLSAHLKALMGKDPSASRRARWALACAGEKSLALIGEVLSLAKDRHDQRQRIAELIERLDDRNYKTREQASTELVRLGELARPQLRQALKGKGSMEMRWRVEALLVSIRRVRMKITAQTVRRQRLLAVLSLIGGESAEEMIARVSGGPYGASALAAGSHWRGICLQDGYPTYFMGLEVTKRTGSTIWGKIHWLATNDSKTLWKGKIIGNRVDFSEYELIQGSGIIIPCDYQVRVVGQQLMGIWKGRSWIGGIQLRLAGDSSRAEE